MNTRTQLRGLSLLTALAMGVLADLLLRVPGHPGLNVSLWAMAGVAVLTFLIRRRGEPVTRETWVLVGAAFGFSVALMLRDAGVPVVFSLFSAILLLIIAAGRATAPWFMRTQVSDAIFSALRVAVLCALGPLGWGGSASDSASDQGWTRTGKILLRGILMAVPALLILTALLMSADPVFERLLLDTFSIDMEALAERLTFIAVIGWLTAGFLRAFLIRDDSIMDKFRVPKLSFAVAEVSLALWLLNILFIVFIAVQLKYLFGGSSLIEVTAGLSYAEYARRGFFELVTVTALVVPILLLADWMAAPANDRSRNILRSTMVVLVVLIFGVMGSAAYRMRLYQAAYGLTEQRLYVSIVIVWLSVVLGWFVFTVVRGNRDRFLSGVVIAGFAAVAVLVAMNPHALIARVNSDRAIAGAAYDAAYLTQLSADAVPVLVSRLDQLPEVQRCQISKQLRHRWSDDRPGGWRTWNLGDHRARKIVKPIANTLVPVDTDCE